MAKIMITTLFVPDLAFDVVNGNKVPVGFVQGKGENIPVVHCPKKGGNERIPLADCFNCQNLEGDCVSQHYLECNYTPTMQHPTQTSISPKKNIKRKEPNGVFRPTEIKE